MRIAVLDLAARQQATGLDQLVDHGGVGVAFLALAVKDVGAAKEGQIGAEAAIVHHVVRDDLLQHAEIAVKLVFLHPVRRRAMDKAGAFVFGHEIGGAEIARVVPFAVPAVCTGQRMCQRHRGKLMRGHVTQAAIHAIVKSRPAHHLASQLVGKDIAVADARPAFLGAASDLVEAVGDVITEHDRLVRRDGPGRCRPDHHVGAHEDAAHLFQRADHVGARVDVFLFAGTVHVRHVEIGDAELDPDRVAFLVVILDLGFGQRGLFHGRPHDRLGPLVERSGHQEFLELLRDDPLGAKVHRQVGFVPCAGDAKALELVALDVDPAFGELAAFLTEIDNIDLVLVLALGAVLFLDLPFDGQAVAIPAGDVARIAAHHLLGPDHHVLEDLVERVTDMQVAVGVGRAVVERERFPLGGPLRGLLAQAVIDAHLGPFFQPCRFAGGQARAHREIGLGQVQRVFVIRCFGAHLERPRGSDQGDVRGAARVSIRLVPAARIVRAPGM